MNTQDKEIVNLNQQSADLKQQTEKITTQNSAVVDNRRLYKIIKEIESLEEEILKLQIKGILE